MADVDRRRARTPGKQRLRQACQPVLSTSATSVWRAKRVLQRVKPEKHELDFCASTASAQRSCGANLELLVCATASHETHYGPCEIPVQTKQPCRFWRQAKIISYRQYWHAARKK